MRGCIVAPDISLGRFLLLINRQDYERHYTIVIKDVWFGSGARRDGEAK